MYATSEKTFCGRGRLFSLLTAFILVPISIAFASDKRPSVEKLPLSQTVFRAEPSTGHDAAHDGVAVAAQSDVTAPIYRSTSCGQQRWIGGQPSWLDQLILFNDGESGAPLRSMSFPVCYDGCHVQNRCVGQGGAEDCDCLAPGDMPLNATFQLYDGNPCDGGVQIAGAGGTVTITAGMLLDAQIGDGQIDCFELIVDVDPKVQIPHEVWVEANFGHDDAWPVVGTTAVEDTSPLSGLNEGVDCTTFCDQGEPQCQNDPDGCDWFLTNMDSNAEIIFTLQPVVPPAETVWASTSTYTVVGDEAILPIGGDRVFFDVMVSDFDPGGANGTQIQSWVVSLEAGGFSSGLAGTLIPADTSCTQDAECLPQMGTASRCIAFIGGCTWIFIDVDRSDYIFFGLNPLTACNAINPICASALITGGVDSLGRESYLMNLVLDVPPNARGTFTIDVIVGPGNPDFGSVLTNTSVENLPFVGMIPGKITIPAGSCCYGLDSATPACANMTAL